MNKLLQFLLGSILILLSLQAFSGISDEKVHLRAQAGLLYCDVDFGFHFNTKAPTSLEANQKKYQPSTKNEKTLSFNLSAAGSENFKLHFYVCDDALTVCEPHDITLRVFENRIVQLASSVSASEDFDTKPSQTVAPKSVQPNENGFYLNQFELAAAQAKKENKLLLIDFSAPWCPACLRLETETFNQKLFKNATSKYIKLSVNIDLDENKPLAERYNVKSIPTLILMASDQNALYQSLDFKSAGSFAKEFAKLNKANLVSEAYLIERANKKKDQNAIWNLARRNFDSMKFEVALDWYHKLSAPNHYQQKMAAAAQIALNQDLDKSETNEKLGAGFYQSAIQNFSESFDAVVWRNELAALLSDKSPDLLNALLIENIERIDGLLAKPKAMMKEFDSSFQGDFSGFERAELLNQKIESQKLQNNSKALAETKIELLKDIHVRQLSLERTGELLMAIIYLKASDQKEEVLSWYQKLISREPQSFVYYAKLANYEHELKEDEKAIAPAEKALALGPELEFRNLKLLAQIQKSLKLNQAALTSIDRALALPDAKSLKNKKNTETLLEMKKNLKK